MGIKFVAAVWTRTHKNSQFVNLRIAHLNLSTSASDQQSVHLTSKREVRDCLSVRKFIPNFELEVGMPLKYLSLKGEDLNSEVHWGRGDQKPRIS